MSQDDFGQVAPLGGGGKDDLDDFKVKRGVGVLIPIIFGVVLLGAIGGAVWYFAFREDPTVAHVQFRREVFGEVHQTYYDEFWACALNEPLDNFKNNKELTTKIIKNASGGDAARYGHHLLENEKCLPFLEKGIPDYRSIKTNPATPPEYGPYLDKLTSNLENIEKSWRNFAEFQANSRDRGKLRKLIKTRGEAWVGYQSSINNRVRDKVAHWEPKALIYHDFMDCVLGDTEYTSFTGEEGQSAQEELVTFLDRQCTQNRSVFLERLGGCSSKLTPEAPLEVTGDFEDAAAYWKRHDNDFGSAVPMMECLSDYEDDHSGTLVGEIAKAWYDFTKSYRELIEFSKTKSGDIAP